MSTASPQPKRYRWQTATRSVRACVRALARECDARTLTSARAPAGGRTNHARVHQGSAARRGGRPAAVRAHVSTRSQPQSVSRPIARRDAVHAAGDVPEDPREPVASRAHHLPAAAHPTLTHRPGRRASVRQLPSRPQAGRSVEAPFARAHRHTRTIHIHTYTYIYIHIHT